ncbi:MAG: 30S ribosomal protein S20 [Candidatus Tumulicola sp.]
MPNIKAAEKWSRQSEKRTTRNKDVTSRLKTLFKKAVSLGDAETSKSVDSAFDKAASKGIIHPNKAARKKGRLAKAIQRAAAAPTKTAKTKATKSTKSAAKKTSKK